MEISNRILGSLLAFYRYIERGKGRVIWRGILFLFLRSRWWGRGRDSLLRFPSLGTAGPWRVWGWLPHLGIQGPEGGTEVIISNFPEIGGLTGYEHGSLSYPKSVSSGGVEGSVGKNGSPLPTNPGTKCPGIGDIWGYIKVKPPVLGLWRQCRKIYKHRARGRGGDLSHSFCDCEAGAYGWMGRRATPSPGGIGILESPPSSPPLI